MNVMNQDELLKNSNIEENVFVFFILLVDFKVLENYSLYRDEEVII